MNGPKGAQLHEIRERVGERKKKRPHFVGFSNSHERYLGKADNRTGGGYSCLTEYLKLLGCPSTRELELGWTEKP